MVIHMQILLATMNDIPPNTEYECLYNQISLYSILCYQSWNVFKCISSFGKKYKVDMN